METITVRATTLSEAKNILGQAGIGVPENPDPDAVLLQTSAVKHTGIGNLPTKAINLAQSLLDKDGNGPWFT